MSKQKRSRITAKGTVPPKRTRNTTKVRNTARTIEADARAANTSEMQNKPIPARQALAQAVLRKTQGR